MNRIKDLLYEHIFITLFITICGFRGKNEQNKFNCILNHLVQEYSCVVGLLEEKFEYIAKKQDIMEIIDGFLLLISPYQKTIDVQEYCKHNAGVVTDLTIKYLEQLNEQYMRTYIKEINAAALKQ